MVEPCRSEWSHGRHYDLEGLEFLRQCFCYVYYDVDYLLDRSIAMIYFAFISGRRLDKHMSRQLLKVGMSCIVPTDAPHSILLAILITLSTCRLVELRSKVLYAAISLPWAEAYAF